MLATFPPARMVAVALAEGLIRMNSLRPGKMTTGQPPISSGTGAERSDAPSDGDGAAENPSAGETGRGGNSAKDQARIDREAGDVADDLADFA